MTPNDIQVSRSKVSVEGQAYSLYVGEGGALVFYKQLYLSWALIELKSSLKIIQWESSLIHL